MTMLWHQCLIGIITFLDFTLLITAMAILSTSSPQPLKEGTSYRFFVRLAHLETANDFHVPLPLCSRL